jgi:hypothetical protein
MFILGGSNSSTKISSTDLPQTVSSVTPTPTVSLNQDQGINNNESEKYKKAISYINEKHYPQAIGILQSLGDYKSSSNLLDQLRYIINGCYISNGQWAVGAITSTGGVTVAYEDEIKYSAVKAWRDIGAISFHGGDSIEGLTKDGAIITSDNTTVKELLSSPVTTTVAMADVVKAVYSWRDIKSFQTFYPQSAIALTKKGIVYVANSYNEDGIHPLKNWDNIVAVADGRSYVAGLKADGTVLFNDYDYAGTIDVADWSDIVAISAGTSLIGLKEDGTVVSTGLNRYGEGNVSQWRDIIAISSYGSCTLGLKSDGTVVAAGQDNYGEMKVSDWRDIIAIGMGHYFSIGLKSDGTMVLAGDCSHSGAETPDVSTMKDLFIPQIEIVN